MYRPGWDRAPMRRSFTSCKDLMPNMLHLRLRPHVYMLIQVAVSSALLHWRSRIYPLRGSSFMLKWESSLYWVSSILTCFSSKLKVPLQGKDGISSPSCWDLTANSFKTALIVSRTKHGLYIIPTYLPTYIHTYRQKDRQTDRQTSIHTYSGIKC